MKKLLFIAPFLLLPVIQPFAGEADVVDVSVSGSGTEFRFSVTVRHADTGWDHYADGWEVVGEDGTVYGKRILHHPHVEEQPFTRSGSASVPLGIKQVIVRAHDSVDGYGGKEMLVDLPGR
ncbi:MAG: hypothetical protein AAF423_01530 [Pseudomonadota bacterium]